MRKPQLIRALAVALVAITAVTLSASAGAATLYEKVITVYTGVNIMVDGVELIPTDANGSQVETFIYNGTTYIPLRAVSQALGKPVNWDGTTRTAYIGKVPGQDMYLSDVCPPYQTQRFNMPETITMAGTRYTNGYTFGSDNYALFNLNGQFSTLEFEVGHVDGQDMRDATLNIYLDGELSYTKDLSAEGLPQHILVPLNGALHMKIVISGAWSNYGMGYPDNYAIVNATIE